MNESSCGSAGCGSSCSGNSNACHDFIEKTHELNTIKRVIGVVSGKGGVGKSLITSTLAITMRRKGYKVGILDADITGPSIPKMFGITKKAEGCEFGIYPQKTHNDISVMSINLLLEKDDSPVIWRGPVIAGTVKQFWTDVIWGDIDYLFLDMPPGTGDVPLTVFQSIPLDGIVIVTSPQDLVSLIVKKAYNMAKAMNIPILGIVENMSYLRCPDCSKEIKLFGESKINSAAGELGIKVLGKMPIDPEIAQLCDKGEIEKTDNEYLADAALHIEKILAINGEEKSVMKIAVATEGSNVSGHFGKCENFTIAEIENSEVKNKVVVNTQGNQHGLLPAFLASHNVSVVIAGGMGEGAKQNLVSKGIEIITGASGNIDEVINSFLNGRLKSSNTGCAGHGHSHGHGNGDSGCNCGHH
ncbi:iron-sulfur cluster carrier protein MrpORP [Pseudobacteroides cellulosolvens]|uniref:Iron-sulfur cluster carrier protein n=1 Tax=Pseudobacteroides cellulosolvens ATCC 35603 = DSM 2933 TaxID=398512 RepID=A0A0L6JJZ6_9FIRM|nr:iron-sulfur cluster carrier protein MrpORP [Pseudobacteroides cellulosolvens]KNY26094.1 ATPase-like, ParA/MinD [Pseudobacteroides cellulosolvens ATCC 35603 = DSM 2933]